MTNKILTQT